MAGGKPLHTDRSHFQISGWMGWMWACAFGKPTCRDFPSGPVVKNLPCIAEDTGSIPGQDAMRLLSPHATTKI